MSEILQLKIRRFEAVEALQPEIPFALAPVGNRQRWADLFDIEVQKILGTVFFQKATLQEDFYEATDFRIYQVGSMRIACHVRHHEYFPKYTGEFPLRRWVASGNDTEFHKVLRGFGDYIFYGFSNEKDDGSGFVSWMVGDLQVFRDHYEAFLRGEVSLRYVEKMNKDGLSALIAFDVRTLPANFIIAEENFLNPQTVFPNPQLSLNW